MAIRLTFDYLAGRVERLGFTLDRIDRGRRSFAGPRIRYELIGDDGIGMPCVDLVDVNLHLSRYVGIMKAIASLEAEKTAPDCRERTIFPNTD